MILNLLIVVTIGLIAYIWMARGLWSAFLHMVCVILAGALAFAFWEPVSLFLAGTGSPMMVDVAWGVGLGVPFAVFLLILRVACDKMVPSNLDLDGVVNTVGGLACGLVSGIISAGFIMLSVGGMRGDSELLGVQAVKYQPAGYLTRQDNLWTRADTLTAWFYEKLSNGTLVPPSGESLGRRHPGVADENWMLRVNFENGKALMTIPPDSFEVTGHYVYAPKNPGDLLKDSVDESAQQFGYADDTTPDPGSEIWGYVVKFKPGAKETTGRTVVGPGQMRLVVQRDPNDPYSTMAVQPLAMASKALPDKPDFGRWRFNSVDVFISSPGADDSPMGFEFVVPKGSLPVALYVKGVPVDVSGRKPSPKFDTMSARDSFIRGGLSGGGGGSGAASGGARDASKAVVFKRNTVDFTGPIRLGDSLPYNLVIQKDVRKGIEINDENRITGGDLAKFRNDELRTQGIDPQLQVRRLASEDDTTIVSIQVDAKNTDFGFLTRKGLDINQPALLYDSTGGTYQAVGYVYKKGGVETWFYFNPQQPLQSLHDKEMPVMSVSKPDEELTLIFRVNKGVLLTEFGVGPTILAKFQPPINTKDPR